MRELVAQIAGHIVHPLTPRVRGWILMEVVSLASRLINGDARLCRVYFQRAFFVARLRGGVSRSAMVAIADGTSR
nr:hypothetical protein GCM10020092_000830 [Actinoplanes digitatis]